jgi:hypothetical protein
MWKGFFSVRGRSSAAMEAHISEVEECEKTIPFLCIVALLPALAQPASATHLGDPAHQVALSGRELGSTIDTSSPPRQAAAAAVTGGREPWTGGMPHAPSGAYPGRIRTPRLLKDVPALRRREER